MEIPYPAYLGGEMEADLLALQGLPCGPRIQQIGLDEPYPAQVGLQVPPEESIIINLD